MPSVEEKLAASLTAETTELLPYLPYLLQDLWELGTNSAIITEILAGQNLVSVTSRLLDLGCGKGAVAVRLAKTFGCHVRGIDLIPAFIGCAKRKAAEYAVASLCDFAAGDINRVVTEETGFDGVIWGSVGNILGNWAATIAQLKRTLRPGGFIIIADAYGADDGDDNYPSRARWLRIFSQAGVTLVAETTAAPELLAQVNRHNQSCIIRRAGELKTLHPEKAALFDNYVSSQQAECDELEGNTTGVTWLLRCSD
ncbi:MAG: SAM-dependent methyltransferase [bacterium]|jgi:cyclopropane fatty-acyl-phospholipid synthase-like methyltransferase